jgi:hypothetical protein
LFKGIEVGGSVLHDTHEETSEGNKSLVVVSSEDGIKVKKEITIQVDGGKRPLDDFCLIAITALYSYACILIRLSKYIHICRKATPHLLPGIKLKVHIECLSTYAFHSNVCNT